MLRFLPGSVGQSQSNMRLTSVADKIKEVFRPGNVVRAKVSKTQGDKVILNLNNNLFQVKTQVPLTEGTWIKGRVHTDKAGNTYLQLLESQEEAELRAKADRFFQAQGSRIEDTQINRELAKAIFSMGKQPTPKMLSDLAGFFSSEGGSGTRTAGEAQEIAFLYLNKIPINDATVGAARGLIQADLSTELSTSPMGDLFLIPERPVQNQQNPDSNPVKTSVNNLFKLFLGPSTTEQGSQTNTNQNLSQIQSQAQIQTQSQSQAQTESLALISGDRSSSGTDSLLDLLGISRAINGTNQDSSQLNPLFGFFLLQTGQSKAPGQFYISRFQREQQQSGYSKKESPTELTLGITLNMEHLGPLVIRMHFMSGVLSLQITAHDESTRAQFDDQLQQLKQQLQGAGLTVARLDTHRAHLEDPAYQRKLAKIPFTPEGNLDFKI